MSARAPSPSFARLLAAAVAAIGAGIVAAIPLLLLLAAAFGLAYAADELEASDFLQGAAGVGLIIAFVALAAGTAAAALAALRYAAERLAGLEVGWGRVALVAGLPGLLLAYLALGAFGGSGVAIAAAVAAWALVSAAALRFRAGEPRR